MKRAALGVAVQLACAGAACAADSLTVFGGVDGNLTRVNAEGRGHVWQVRDGGMYVSKIGFTGSEDLGSGYRAHFYIESQANSDAGTGVATNPTNLFSGTPGGAAGLNWNRKSTLSLFTPVGEFRMGRDYTATFVPATYFDPFFSAGVASAVNYQPYYKYIAGTGLNFLLAPGTLVRASNMVGYFIPPTWAPGVYLYVQASPSEGVGPRYTGVGTGYRRGPLLVSAAFAKTKRPLGDAGAYLTPASVSADNYLNVWSAGASYNFNGFTVMGFYHSQKFDAFGQLGGPTESNRKVDDLLVGFSWALGPSTVKFTGMSRNDKGFADADSRQFGLGYSYHFSKRTAVYANYVDIRNDNSANYNFISSGFTPSAGGKAGAVQGGISHNF